MYAKVRETASEVVIFVARNVVERMLGFLLIPVYTRTFDPKEYGVLVLLLTTEAFLSQILNFGITTAFFRTYYDDDTDEGRLTATSTAAWFLIAANLLFLLVALPLAPYFGATFFPHADSHTLLVQLMLVLTTLDTLNYLPFVILKAKQRSKLFVGISWAATVVQFGTIIVLVVGFGMGIRGALIGTVVGTAVKSVVYFWILRKQVAWRFSVPVLKPLLLLGFPVIFNSIATLVLKVSDRFFLNHYFSSAEVALYQIADQFGAILPLLVANPFSLVWPAMRFKVMKDDDAGEYYSRVLTYLTFASLYMGVGIAALAPDVIRVVAHKDYGGAAAIVPLFVLYYILATTAKGVNVGLMIEKQAHWNAIVVIVAALVNIALNYWWIPIYGMYGAIYATIVAFAFMNWFRWYMSNRFYPVDYEWGRIVKMTVVAAGLYALASLVSIPNPYLSFVARAAIVTPYPALLALVGFYDSRERARIAELWSTGLRPQYRER